MKKAFTLADVLITLTIIGIVAMMAIPTMNNNISDMHFKAAARKTFAVLNDAISMTALNGYIDTHIPLDSSSSDIKVWFEKYLSKNLNVIRICDNNEKGCWHDKTVTYGLNKKAVTYSEVGQIGSNALTAILNDGSSINIDVCSKDDVLKLYGVAVDTEAGLTLYFDVNGDKGPNVLGRDIYVAVFKDDTLVPAWSDMSLDNINKNCSKAYNGSVSETINGTAHNEFTNVAGYSCLNKALIEDMQTHD